MGTRGPIPKRDDERIRRNKTGEDGIETEVVEMQGKVKVPDLNLGVETHQMVQDMWDSLPSSGETKHWEPSDWQYARLTMYAINELLYAPNGMPAMKLTAIDGMMSKLLLTEGDRRRVKMEVKRSEADAAVIDAEKYFRAAFEQQAQQNRKQA
jgi:hypothetical protein